MIQRSDAEGGEEQHVTTNPYKQVTVGNHTCNIVCLLNRSRVLTDNTQQRLQMSTQTF